MKTIHYPILSMALLGVLFLGCGDDRAQPLNANKAVGGVSQINDSDGDGLSDEDELENDLNLSNADSDGDGLDDFYENSRDYLDAKNPDTDGDTLLDGAEVNTYFTRPDLVDTDNDGLDDPYEVTHDEVNATNPDTDGDGLKDGEEVNTYGTRPDLVDTDGDGLTDAYEVAHADVNATNPDTDGDGLNDGEEVNRYHTQPNNPDSDHDTLSDYQELFETLTDPLNPDTDSDCLLDGFEINNYETNATLKDTDGDSVEDGIEIYSYTVGEINSTCLYHPETLEGGYNPHPAIDGIPDLAHDVINALDPTNDTDGDGQANTQELNCTEGDAKDKNKLCPYIINSYEGQILTEHGYSYVPGGFDVDGDGIKEGGFWISRYQARKTETEISSQTVITKVGNINKYVSENFLVLNKNVEVTSYNEDSLSETNTLAGNQLIFDEDRVAGLLRISSFTPYLALVCLKEYRLKDANGTVLDIPITMPTLKQYVQVKMLLDADLANNGDGRHIRNGLLATDPHVPLWKYNLIIDEFSEEKKEYVLNLVQLRDTYGNKTFDISDIPGWWRVDPDKFKAFLDGANSTQDLGHGVGPDKDPYAVVVRGGEILDVTEGIAGALTDDDGDTNGISFRAATPYLY